MAHCPSCQAELADDFGLIECAQCGAPLIMHVDGSVEAASPVAFPANNDEDFANASYHPPPEEDVFAEAADPLVPPILFDETPAGDAEDKPDIFAATNSGVDPTSQDAAVGSADLSDIARFGNSDQTSSRDGMLRYNIMIAGIDTSDVRERLREIIIDRKFMWDSDAILRAITDGEVRIENLVASKAFVLVSRLRVLPVEVRWEQYAVHSN